MRRERVSREESNDDNAGVLRTVKAEVPSDGQLDDTFADAEEETILESLEQGLEIDEHGLDQAVQEQPTLLYDVSKRLALITSRRDAAKQNLQLVEARVDARVREEARANEQKTTETEVANRIKQSVEVIRANQNLLRLNNNIARLSALKEAYMQRSYALKDLAALHIASYYSDPSVGTVNDRTHTARAVEARKGMSRARREED